MLSCSEMIFLQSSGSKRRRGGSSGGPFGEVIIRLLISGSTGRGWSGLGSKNGSWRGPSARVTLKRETASRSLRSISPGCCNAPSKRCGRNATRNTGSEDSLMIRVNREEVLRVLESVTPGLASREIIQQSTCLVFEDDRVFTFNDEVGCSRESPIKGFTGAIKAKPLLDLFSKMPEDELGVEWNGKEIQVHGKKRKSGIRVENE